MELKSKLLDPHRGLYLYGTTPPRQGSSQDKLYGIAEKLTARLSNLKLDAINVYDIQDEAGRTEVARPFPFLPVVDSREYSQILKNLSGQEIINYKCVVHHPKADFPAWLDQSWEQFGLRYLTLVGGSTSNIAYPGPSLSQASEAVASHKYDFAFGGVTIAERHISKGNEHLKLIAKSQKGMNFFTSQVIYQPEATIKLLQDYSQQCQKLKISPVRIILTFAPCGYPKTLDFLKWLGVNVPKDIEEEIFAAKFPVEKSVEVCCSTLRQILASVELATIPLGINVESVSIKKDEIDASIELFQQLKEILAAYYEKK
ncbi:MAG: hypothetical protein QNJ18_04285 [Xenococcaceae cyanobacterium MO_167.B52]|nr:hypothetical protein [Xenococcaceae cyanobacterium MO_167.B52]